MLSDENVRELINIYDSNKEIAHNPSNISISMIGGFIVWSAGLLFCASAGKYIEGADEKHNPTTIMLNCLIASTASAFAYMFIDLFLIEKSTIKKILPEPIYLMHAALSGLFAISAGCNNISQRDSFFVGLINAVLYAIAIKIYVRFKIDDPCQSSIVHGVSGFWGVISVGIFDHSNGLFYTGNSNLMKIQALGTLAILSWSITLSFSFFFTVSKLGRLRIPSVYETIGIDLLAHSCIKDLESFKK
jgi:Amt family ammonium transporter